MGLPQAQGQVTQVVAIHGQHVEGIELHLFVMLPRIQGVKVGHAVDAEHHRLAVDHELAGPVPESGLHDPVSQARHTNRGLAQSKRDTNYYLRFGGDFGGAEGGDRSTGANCCVSQASMITDWRVPL